MIPYGQEYQGIERRTYGCGDFSEHTYCYDTDKITGEIIIECQRCKIRVKRKDVRHEDKRAISDIVGNG